MLNMCTPQSLGIKMKEEIFNKISVAGDASLNELVLELRYKLELNESVASSSTYKDVPIDFNYYKNAAR